MQILVFGAGALGTLYAARLARAGHEVSVVARGRRLEEIRSAGLRIRQRKARETQVATVRAVERIDEAPHELMIVLVRRHQLDAVLPLVGGASAESDVLMMVNLATGYDGWRAALGRRLLVGFAGAAATFAADGVLEYMIAPARFQPTVLGEPDGSITERVERVAGVLSAAGFPVQTRADMEDWQRSHVAWIVPFMLACGAVDGDPARFAEGANVRRWIDATKEALQWVRSRGRLTPSGLGAAAALPAPVLTALARIAVASPGLRAQLVATGRDSQSEAVALADDMLALAKETSTALPHLAELRDLATRR
jgi:2-dehydropantoate 2-reductase